MNHHLHTFCGKILVVDDDEAIRELASEALGMNGFDVCTASDGLEVQCLLDAHVPDVLLLDVLMPEGGRFFL